MDINNEEHILLGSHMIKYKPSSSNRHKVLWPVWLTINKLFAEINKENEAMLFWHSTHAESKVYLNWKK